MSRELLSLCMSVSRREFESVESVESFGEASYMTLCFARSRLAISCQELERVVCKLKAPRMEHTPCVF